MAESCLYGTIEPVEEVGDSLQTIVKNFEGLDECLGNTIDDVEDIKNTATFDSTSNTLTVDNVVIDDDLTVNDDATINGDLTIKGATNIDGSITLSTAAINTLRDLLSISSNPVGTIIASGSTVVPDGYLYCNGQAVQRTGTYSGLFSAIGTNFGSGNGNTTFNVPDLRGRFLRGQADGTSNDPDKSSRTAMNTGGKTGDNIGSVQSDQFKSHQHDIPTGNTSNREQINPLHTENFTGYVAETRSTGGNETRPKNAYVRYYIKY